MADHTYDFIVVGLGAMGSATTCHLARRGYRVLGIDMFELGHQQGSSHGYHRMIRMSSKEYTGYVPLGERALDLWRELEQESGHALLSMIGEVRLIDLNHLPEYQEISQQMNERGFWELLEPDELASRYPGFRLHDGMIAAFEERAGFLRSEGGIAAHLEVATQRGATLRRSEEVTAWDIEGDGVRVTTSKGTYSAGKLIVTTGPWAAELLEECDFPLQVERVVNGYFEPSRPDWWAVENGAPDFLLEVPEGVFYGMPAVDGIGLKIGLSGGEGLAPTTARTVERNVDQREIDFLRDVLDKYMPGASGPELRHITCMCTYTTDDGFILDRHPQYAQVLIGCGFCGRGFKFSPVVGEILADLAIDGQTAHDIGFMSARRFTAQTA